MAESTHHDFDFLMGRWRVAHRRLNGRLVNSTDWQEFEGTCTAQPILDGRGNIDDNVLNLPAGTYRAATIRTFDSQSRQWAIWWLDSRYPDNLGTPVVGAFERGVGTFYSDDLDNGRNVRTRFRWTRTDTPSPSWEQAMSADAGGTWEINWTMDFTRIEG